VIRWKIFTLGTALVLRTAGHLSAGDQAAASEALHTLGLAVHDQSR